eukprot:1362705-Amphidinium_carterae.1
MADEDHEGNTKETRCTKNNIIMIDSVDHVTTTLVAERICHPIISKTVLQHIICDIFVFCKLLRLWQS